VQIEAERDAGEVAVGQVGEARVAEEVVAVPENEDGEVSGVAEDARDLEAGLGG